MNLTLLTDAGILDEPLLVTEAGDYLNQVPDSDLTLVQSLITAARLEAENENGRELAVKQWMLVLDRFPTGGGLLAAAFYGYYGYALEGRRTYNFNVDPRFIELLDPLVSVDKFTYKKSDGTVVTLVEDTDYVVDKLKHPGIVCPVYGAQWPGDTLWPSSAVQITFTAGFTPDQCPANIVQGMKLLIVEWYEQRVPFAAIRFVAEMPFSVSNCFRTKKLWRF